MKIKIVTALYNINRESLGDGRSIDQYLAWIEQTLKLNAEFVIFTSSELVDKFQKIAGDNCIIMIEDLSKSSYYQFLPEIERVLGLDEYRSTVMDSSRIECNLPLYNIIQYSKFYWMNKVFGIFPDIDYVFWMDAGCSRFFEDVDISKPWPKIQPIQGKLTIQGNVNYKRLSTEYTKESCIDMNECIVVGTLFGAGRYVCNSIDVYIKFLLSYFLNLNKCNNEQILLGYLSQRLPYSIKVIEYDQYHSHLPIFKTLAGEV